MATKIEKQEQEENVKLSKTVHKEFGHCTHVLMEIKNSTENSGTEKTVTLCLNGDIYKCYEDEDIELPYMALEVMKKTHYSWKDVNKKIFKPYQYVLKKYIWKNEKGETVYSEFN